MSYTSSKATVIVGDFYRITWFLLIAIDGTLASTTGVARPQITVPFFLLSLSLVTRFAADLARRRSTIGYGIGLALFLMGVEQIARIKSWEDVIGALVEITCATLPLLLLGLSGKAQSRAYWLSLLNVVIIGITTITFSSNLFIYLGFISLVALVLLNLNAANLYLENSVLTQNRTQLPASYFRQFFYVMPVGLISAVIIFLTFPRVQSFSVSLGHKMGGLSTGYSGLVALDGGGEMQTSQQLAFIAEASDKKWLQQGAEDLYFRGDSLDHFDGVHWSSTSYDFKTAAHFGDARVAQKHRFAPIQMTIHMEPAPQTTVFYPGILANIYGLNGNSANFLINSSGSVMRESFGLERFSYVVNFLEPLDSGELPSTSAKTLQLMLATKVRNDGRPYNLDPKEVPRFLAVPANVAAAPYFKSWLAEVALDPEKVSIAEIEKRLAEVFSHRFKATLANKFDPATALETFLGTARAGHCEYFATAAALTLRSLGIPARVVVGFHGGTYNKLIEALEVRDENAHAWVDVYVPGVGWHAFDPTPANATLPLHNVFSDLRLYMNATSFWLHQYLIDYNQSAQNDLYQAFKELGSGRGENHQLASPGRNTVLAVLVFTSVALGMWFWRTRRRQGQELSGLPPYYRTFRRWLSKNGHQRQLGETYASMHARLKQQPISPDLLAALDSALAQDLYGKSPTDKEQQLILEGRLQQSLKRRA